MWLPPTLHKLKVATTYLIEAEVVVVHVVKVTNTGVEADGCPHLLVVGDLGVKLGERNRREGKTALR